jgi:hypothetical protein
MVIRNIIQKAEQEFPPGIKQELDPARPELALLSGYVDISIGITISNQQSCDKSRRCKRHSSNDNWRL